MKKKYYQKPDTKTVELEYQQMIAVSPDGPDGPSGSRSVSSEWNSED